MIERAPARWVTIRLEANLQRQPNPSQVIFAHLEPCKTYCKCNRTYDRFLLFFSPSVSHAHLQAALYFRQSRVGLRLEDVLVA